MFNRIFALPHTLQSANGKRLSLGGYAFLVLVCFAMFVPGIVGIPPTDRDESLFAQASKQMVETSNYIDIKVQDKPRYKKPVGIYWLQSAAVQLFNPGHLNEIWAYRLPSFFGATLAVLGTAALGSLLFGPMAGLLAALMLAGCVLLNVEARLAKTDAALLATIVWAQYALAHIYKGTTKTDWTGFFIFWLALAAGILIKGPIILLATLGTVLWMRRGDKNLSRFRGLKPMVGIPLLLLLVAPWFVTIMLQSHGSFAEQSAGHDLLGKLWQGQDRGMVPPGMHALILPLVFFPASIFVMLALPDILAKRRTDNYRLLLGWVVPMWVVFELALTKLPHYVLPAYPALALMAADCLYRGYPALLAAPRKWLAGAALTLWILVGFGIALLPILLPIILGDGTLSTHAILAAIAIFLAEGVGIYFLFQRRAEAVTALTLGSIFYMTLTFGGVIPTLPHLWLGKTMTDKTQIYTLCNPATFITLGYNEPSFIFLAGTNTITTNNGASVMEAIRATPCPIIVVGREHQAEFLDAAGRQHLDVVEADTIHGYNLGRGKSADLIIYTLPQKDRQ